MDGDEVLIWVQIWMFYGGDSLIWDQLTPPADSSGVGGIPAESLFGFSFVFVVDSQSWKQKNQLDGIINLKRGNKTSVLKDFSFLCFLFVDVERYSA